MAEFQENHLHILGALLSRRLAADTLSEETWQPVIGAARAHGLGPMLMHTLESSGASPTDTAWETLRASSHRAAALYLALEEAAYRAEAALRRRDISTLWLKGMALANTVYPDAGLRPMSDLDVLVPFEQREPAMHAASEAGFTPYEHPGRIFGTGDEMGTSHHYHLKDTSGAGIILEVHFRMLPGGDELLPPAEQAWFWEQTVRIGNGRLNLNVLKPEANLLYLCAHAALGHGEAEFYLLRYFDIHRVITGAAIDWDLVLNKAIALGWAYPTARGLRISGEHFGSSFPQSLLERLETQQGDSPAKRRAIRLQKPLREWEGVLDQLGRLPPLGRMRMMRRLLFPPPDYIQRRYSLSRKWQVWAYYPYRWLDLARKWAAVTWARRVPGK